MSWYEYSVDDSAGNQVSVLITMGKTKVATSLIMQPNLSPDFESYSVQPQFRGKGFAYALTHLMLLYCDSKKKHSATCNNAHGHLIETLKGVGFNEVHRHYDPMAKQQAASLSCVNIANALNLCKAKMLDKGLIQQGFRNVGPYQW